LKNLAKTWLDFPFELEIVPYCTVINGILYRLRTGCQWQMIPTEYGSGSTCHRRFQEWEEAGIFEQLWRVLLRCYDRQIGSYLHRVAAPCD
jgi:transposase